MVVVVVVVITVSDKANLFNRYFASVVVDNGKLPKCDTMTGVGYLILFCLLAID